MKKHKIMLFICLAFLVNCKEDFPIEKYLDIFDKGNIIIFALENYYKENNSYPSNLGLLIPEYMKAIPETGLKNRPFSYIKSSNDKSLTIGYQLTVLLDKPGLFMVGAGQIKRAMYQPNHKYRNDDIEITHKVVKGWAIQTVNRS